MVRGHAEQRASRLRTRLKTRGNLQQRIVWFLVCDEQALGNQVCVVVDNVMFRPLTALLGCHAYFFSSSKVGVQTPL